MENTDNQNNTYHIAQTKLFKLKDQGANMSDCCSLSRYIQTGPQSYNDLGACEGDGYSQDFLP